MDKPVIVSFRWSAEEMLRAQRFHMRYSGQGRKLWRLFIGGGAVFLILGTVSIMEGQNSFAWTLPFFILAGVFFSMPLFIRRAILKMYAQKPDRDMLVTYEISPDRIASKSEVGSTDALWRTIIRARRLPEGFFLYPTDRTFHWLPVHGFRDSGDIERLAQITKSNVKEYNGVA